MNEWLTHTHNSKKLNHLFNTLPSFDECEIFEMRFDRNGPTIQLKLNATGNLDLKPAAWQEYNSVVLDVVLLSVYNVRLDGWTTDNFARIRVKPNNDNHLNVRLTYPHGQLRCTCIALSLLDVAAYLNELGP